ncbi:MAG: hypothetical protein H7228_03320 [Polaromonas sp.]|nr:hypothetical protein [Polaromonas sp.]
MKSSFKLKDGSTITVTALHAAKHVMVEKIYPLGSSNDPRSFFIPPELSGVVAQAIELAGQAVINGPCRPKEPTYAWVEADRL